MRFVAVVAVVAIVAVVSVVSPGEFVHDKGRASGDVCQSRKWSLYHVLMMRFHTILWIMEPPPRADKSAVCSINRHLRRVGLKCSSPLLLLIVHHDWLALTCLNQLLLFIISLLLTHPDVDWDAEQE